MAVFSQSSHHGDGSRALDTFGPPPAFVLARPDRHAGERPRLDDIGWRRARRLRLLLADAEAAELDGGATEMLGRVIVYAYVVLLMASLLLEQPIPLAIGP